MPLPTNLNAYADVRAILDECRKIGGGVYKLGSEGQAINWRRRAYTFRKLIWNKLTAQSLDPAYVPTSPYDDMTLRLDGSAVIIEFGKVEGKLETLNGASVKVEAFSKPQDDELMKEALDLLEGLGDEDPDPTA